MGRETTIARKRLSDILTAMKINARTRQDERRKSPGAPGRVNPTPSEPIYDQIYEEALGLMAEDEGMAPRPPRKHSLEGPG